MVGVWGADWPGWLREAEPKALRLSCGNKLVNIAGASAKKCENINSFEVFNFAKSQVVEEAES